MSHRARRSRYRTGYIHEETFGPREVQYRLEGKLAILEGDIVLGTEREMEAARRHLAGGMHFLTADFAAKPSLRWPDAVVPFRISSAMPEEVDGLVRAAIKEFTSRTPLRFPQREKEKDFVTFRPGPKLRSAIGRQGGEQTISLTPKVSAGQIMHEIGHTVGLYHTHSRPDRDDFITIRKQNIRPGYEGEFQIVTAGVVVGLYDYASIMHYGTHAFSRTASHPTIIVKPRSGGGVPAIGQWTRLSDGDVAAIKALYG